MLFSRTFVESSSHYQQTIYPPVVTASSVFTMNTPYVRTAENTFYSLNGPAFSRREFGGAASHGPNDQASVSSDNDNPKLKWNNKYFASAGGISRFILIVSLLKL